MKKMMMASPLFGAFLCAAITAMDNPEHNKPRPKKTTSGRALMEEIIVPASSFISYFLAHRYSGSQPMRARALQAISIGASIAPAMIVFNHVCPPMQREDSNPLWILPACALFYWQRVFRLARLPHLSENFPAIVASAASANGALSANAFLEHEGDTINAPTLGAMGAFAAAYFYARRALIPFSITAFSIGNASLQFGQTTDRSESAMRRVLASIATAASIHAALVSPASLGSLSLSGATMALRSFMPSRQEQKNNDNVYKETKK